LGVTFGSPEEAMLAIETVALMKQANETVAAVQETKQSSLVKKANAMLRAALTSSEPAPQVEVSPDVSTAIKALIS
jgi:hypothetical protein